MTSHRFPGCDCSWGCAATIEAPYEKNSLMRNLKKQFDCYDRLPLELRQTLANTAFDWDATLVAEALDLGAAPEGIISRILEDERRRLPIDNYVSYGPQHPGAAPSVQANWLRYYQYPTKRDYWWGR